MISYAALYPAAVATVWAAGALLRRVAGRRRPVLDLAPRAAAMTSGPEAVIAVVIAEMVSSGVLERADDGTLRAEPVQDTLPDPWQEAVLGVTGPGAGRAWPLPERAVVQAVLTSGVVDSQLSELRRGGLVTSPTARRVPNWSWSGLAVVAFFGIFFLPQHGLSLPEALLVAAESLAGLAVTWLAIVQSDSPPQ